MKENYIETTSLEPHSSVFRRVSWGAIFAGVIVTVVLQLVLTLLGTGIGAATVQPLQESNPGKGLGTGAAIWFMVSMLISVYIGARVAGNLSGAPKSERKLHGILTWATTAIASMVFLTSTAGTLFGGAASFLGGATAARTQPAYAQGQPATGGAVASPTSRDDQRAQQVQNEQRAREVGDVAGKRVSQAALWSFFAMVLSAVVAAYGAGSGAPETQRPVGGFKQPHPQPA